MIRKRSFATIASALALSLATPAIAHAQDAPAPAPAPSAGLSALSNPSELSLSFKDNPWIQGQRTPVLTLNNKTDNLMVSCRAYVYPKDIIVDAIDETLKDPNILATGAFSEALSTRMQAAVDEGHGFRVSFMSVAPGKSEDASPTFGGGDVKEEGWEPKALAGCKGQPGAWETETIGGEEFTFFKQDITKEAESFLLLYPKDEVNPLIGSLANTSGSSNSEGSSQSGSSESLAGSSFFAKFIEFFKNLFKGLITGQFIFGDKPLGSI